MCLTFLKHLNFAEEVGGDVLKTLDNLSAKTAENHKRRCAVGSPKK
jgi:hypothetical protein